MCILHGLSRFNSEKCNADYPKVCLNVEIVNVCACLCSSWPRFKCINIVTIIIRTKKNFTFHKFYSLTALGYFVCFLSFTTISFLIQMKPWWWSWWRLVEFVSSGFENLYGHRVSITMRTAAMRTKRDVIAHSLWPNCTAILVGFAEVSKHFKTYPHTHI